MKTEDSAYYWYFWKPKTKKELENEKKYRVVKEPKIRLSDTRMSEHEARLYFFGKNLEYKKALELGKQKLLNFN